MRWSLKPQRGSVFTLSGAERPYRIMIEMLNEGSAILVRNGTIFYCNRRFAEMVGTPLEKTIGMSIYHFIKPPERKMFEALLKQAIRGNARHETSFRSANGENVPVLLSVSNLRGINAPGSICLVAADISESKQSEKSLRESERELRIKSESLEEVNSALKVLLKRVEEGQFSLEEKILSNIRELVLP